MDIFLKREITMPENQPTRCNDRAPQAAERRPSYVAARSMIETLAVAYERGIRRTAWAAASICMLAALPACQPKMSAEAEYQQARQQYARAAERLAKEATPITDRAALAKRLNLSPERFGVIKTGPQVTGPIVLAFDQGSNCKDRKSVV